MPPLIANIRYVSMESFAAILRQMYQRVKVNKVRKQAVIDSKEEVACPLRLFYSCKKTQITLTIHGLVFLVSFVSFLFAVVYRFTYYSFALFCFKLIYHRIGGRRCFNLAMAIQMGK